MKKPRRAGLSGSAEATCVAGAPSLPPTSRAAPLSATGGAWNRCGAGGTTRSSEPADVRGPPAEQLGQQIDPGHVVPLHQFEVAERERGEVREVAQMTAAPG